MSYPISWGLTAVLFIVYYYFDQKKFYKTHHKEILLYEPEI